MCFAFLLRTALAKETDSERHQTILSINRKGELMILVIFIGGIFVWPMIAMMLEKIRDKKNYLFSLLYLTIYTEVLIAFACWSLKN